MATSRIRHRGRPPRDVDHGPANGAGGSTLIGAHAQVAQIAQAQASRVFEVGGRMPDGGAGRIERSMATEAQREAWRAEPATPTRVPMRVKLEVDGVHAKGSPEERAALSKARQADHVARQALGSPEHLHASRMRGGERNRQLVAAAHVATVTGPTVTARTITEEAVMAIEPPPVTPEPEAGAAASLGTRIALVAEAAAAASDAWSELQMAVEAERAAEAALAAAETRWDDARAALEASWRSTGMGPVDVPARIAEVLGTRAEQRHERLSNGEAAEAVVESPADHAETIPVADRLTDPGRIDPSLDTHSESSEPVDDAPEVVTRRPETPAASMASFTAERAARAAGGGPGLSASQERVLAAVRNASGNLKVAANALGITGQGVQTSLRHIGEKGGIPLDLIPLLPAGYAKYRPAGI